MIIDAKDILTAEMMADFVKEIGAKDEVSINVADFIKTGNKYSLKDAWKSKELADYYAEHADAEFDIVSSNGCMMILTHYDYTWWLKNSRRINKLFKCLDDELAQASEEQHSVACGFKQPGKIFGIHVFTGSMTQCIDALNKDLKDKTLQNVENNAIVLCMNFVQGQKNVWKTYDELKAEGTIL